MTHIDRGTYSTPMASAIYHYRRHVLCDLGSAPVTTRASSNDTIEAFIEGGAAAHEGLGRLHRRPGLLSIDSENIS